MTRSGGICGLALAGLLGCGPSYSELKVEEIQSVAVLVDGGAQRFCAYKPAAVRARVTYRNGNSVDTPIPGESQRKKLRTTEFQWTTTIGSIDEQAVLRLEDDPLAWYASPIEVAVEVLARPEITSRARLEPRFDCGGTLDLRGALGARGGEAEPGGPGAPGPEVEVALAYLAGGSRDRLALLRVRKTGSEPEYFVVDAGTETTPVVIDVRGGDGGRGGQGVSGIPGFDGRDGMDGEPCMDGTPGEDGGEGGPGGPGQDGGIGGPGGVVVVRYDIRFPELLRAVDVRIDGGAAGEAGLGGAGGRGGAPGKGGRGGPDDAAPPTEGGEPPPCGADGPDGQRGGDGVAGEPGQPGSAGPPGSRSDAPAQVAELFSEEIARGMNIVVGGGR